MRRLNPAELIEGAAYDLSPDGLEAAKSEEPIRIIFKSPLSFHVQSPADLKIIKRVAGYALREEDEPGAQYSTFFELLD